MRCIMFSQRPSPYEMVSGVQDSWCGITFPSAQGTLTGYAGISPHTYMGGDQNEGGGTDGGMFEESGSAGYNPGMY